VARDRTLSLPDQPWPYFPVIRLTIQVKAIIEGEAALWTCLLQVELGNLTDYFRMFRYPGARNDGFLPLLS
jgi:hypothetical protein